MSLYTRRLGEFILVLCRACQYDKDNKEKYDDNYKLADFAMQHVSKSLKVSVNIELRDFLNYVTFDRNVACLQNHQKADYIAAVKKIEEERKCALLA